MITIHYDFTDGSEISYFEGCQKKDNFTTNCLEFFNMTIETDDVVVLKKDGSFVSRKNIYNHTDKEIRKEHDIRKMLLAGSFKWLSGDSKVFKINHLYYVEKVFSNFFHKSMKNKDLTSFKKDYKTLYSKVIIPTCQFIISDNTDKTELKKIVEKWHEQRIKAQDIADKYRDSNPYIYSKLVHRSQGIGYVLKELNLLIQNRNNGKNSNTSSN